MGPAFIEDLLRRSRFHKKLQHFAVPALWVLHQRVQLSVGKRPRAALPELDVGFGIQNPQLPEPLYGSRPLCGSLSPFQKDRAIARSCQHKPAEQPGRPGPHNDRPAAELFGSRFRKPVPDPVRLAYGSPAPLQDRRFFSNLHLHLVYITQFSAPGVQRPPDDLIPDQLFRADPQGLYDLFSQFLPGMLHRQLQLLDLQHGFPLSFRMCCRSFLFRRLPTLLPPDRYPVRTSM